MIFYNTIVFLYSRNIGNFTEQLLIDNLKMTNEQAIDILEKMYEFNIVDCKQTIINEKIIKLYSVCHNPQILLLFAMLDMTVKKHKNYCYYFEGPTDYFHN